MQVSHGHERNHRNMISFKTTPIIKVKIKNPIKQLINCAGRELRVRAEFSI